MEILVTQIQQKKDKLKSLLKTLSYFTCSPSLNSSLHASHLLNLIIDTSEGDHGALRPRGDWLGRKLAITRKAWEQNICIVENNPQELKLRIDCKPNKINKKW